MRAFYFFMLLLAAADTACSAELKLNLTGTELNGGGPMFEVMVGKQLVGRGAVEPISAAGKSIEFVFQVDDNLMSSTADVEVHFTNDAYVEGEGDRNLTIISLTVAGMKFDPSNLKFKRSGADFLSSSGTLYTNSDVAIATSPPMGWHDQKRNELETPAIATPHCEPFEFSVTGFANGVAELNDDQRLMLDQIVQKKECTTWKVVGYSSVDGPEEINLTTSHARAQNVAKRLSDAGVARDLMQITGVGETTTFGVRRSDNRRVIVSGH